MSKQFSPDPQRALELLAACPAYRQTPLIEIAPLQSQRVLVKDESQRMGLGAFKALGGVYAVAQLIRLRWHAATGQELAPARMMEEEVNAFSRQICFVCASAGNHGLAVAKGAQLFGASCRVHLAASVPETFASRLTALGATVLRSGQSYEDSMESAAEDAAEPERILLADSSWADYTEIPSLVMEGYTVLAEELRENFADHQTWPSHVFLQAGVGGLAAAVSHHIRHRWPSQPRLIVVEPDAAPCLYESHRQGRLSSVAGPQSSMGRLDCKEASMLAFDVLHEHADDFVLISDQQAEAARETLARSGFHSSASGAAGFGALLAQDELGLDLPEAAVCLVIVSEGAAD